MKKLICTLICMIFIIGCVPTGVFAETESRLSFTVQSDYETLILIYDCEELNSVPYFLIEGNTAEAEYTYLKDYRAAVQIDEAWFDKDITVSFHAGDSALETRTISIPSLSLENDSPFEIRAILSLGEDNSLSFKPQKENRFLFLPSGPV